MAFSENVHSSCTLRGSGSFTSDTAAGDGCFCRTSEVSGTTEFLDQLLQGDEAAFSALFEMHRAQMYRTAMRILRNDDDAQDAVQEAFLNAFKRIDKFRAESSLSTWLTRIVINCCLMVLRKKRRYAVISLDEETTDSLTLMDCIHDGSMDVERDVIQRDSEHYLDQSINQLPNLLYEVVVEYRRGDPTMIELAKRCGVSVPAAKSRLLRARKMLREAHLARGPRLWKRKVSFQTLHQEN